MSPTLVQTHRVLAQTPRTNDPREIERWQRLVAKLANRLETNVRSLIYLSFATTAVDAEIETDILKVTASCTITVPTAVGVEGLVYRIDNAHSGTTTVEPTGAETIEGETSQTLSGQCCIDIYSDGENWRIL